MEKIADLHKKIADESKKEVDKKDRNGNSFY